MWFASCQAISQGLANYLSAHYPQAIVAIRRGHPNDAMVMLTRAPTVICCASTFCLYPALARSHGTSYLQRTTLLANNQTPPISPHIHWMDQEHMTFRDPGRDQWNSTETIQALLTALTSDVLI